MSEAAARISKVEEARQGAAGASVFTVVAGGETLGVPIESVRTIFRVEEISPIPLAPDGVLGLVNVRGKIVTAVSLRQRLGMEEVERDLTLAVGVERRGEDFAIVVDDVREVASLAGAPIVSVPSQALEARAELVREVYRLESNLLTVLDMDALLEFGRPAPAAGRKDRPQGEDP
jgi:purine-binding chemotaxis protein CheW